MEEVPIEITLRKSASTVQDFSVRLHLFRKDKGLQKGNIKAGWYRIEDILPLIPSTNKITSNMLQFQQFTLILSMSGQFENKIAMKQALFLLEIKEINLYASINFCILRKAKNVCSTGKCYFLRSSALSKSAFEEFIFKNRSVPLKKLAYTYNLALYMVRSLIFVPVLVQNSIKLTLFDQFGSYW